MILFEKSFIQKVSIVIVVDASIKLLSFIILPIYLSYMPKNDFGEFGFIFTTAVTLSTVMSLNFYVVIIRDLSRNEDKLNNSKHFSTMLLFISVFNIFILFFAYLMESNFSLISNFFNIKFLKFEKIICFLLIIFFNVVSLFQYSLILSRKKSFEICTYIVLKFIFTNLISLIFLIKYNSIYDTVFLRLIGILIGEIFLFLILQLSIGKKYFLIIFDIKYLKEKFLLVLPLIFATFLSLLMTTVDRKLLQSYHGNSYLAEYNLVYILLLPLSMIISSFQSIWNPRLFKIDTFNEAFTETKSVLKYIFIFLLFTSLLIYLTVKILLDINIINQEYNSEEFEYTFDDTYKLPYFKEKINEYCNQ